MIVYDDMISGNCLEVNYTVDHLGIPNSWKPIDVVNDETHTPEFLGEIKIQPVH